MINLPLNGKYNVPNNSDLFGNIWYTKNINFDEEGYITLSPRAVSINSEKLDSNIGIPNAFGRKNTGNSIVPASQFVETQIAQKAYWLVLSETALTFNVHVGTGVATLTADSHGTWFKNLWHVTNDTDLFVLTSITDTATYTEITDGTPANLTAGKVHAVETFKNLESICVTNGNTVNRYTESSGTYTLATTLTVPADYECVGLAYSNNTMGIIAMLSDTSSGQNQEAFFFTWNGSTTAAGAGVPIGSDKPVAICAYKGSFVILSRTGQLSYFNGSSFTPLASFPFYYQGLFWGNSYSREMFGNVLQVDGDLIYINMNSVLNASGDRYETYLQNNPAGIWCYDPSVGLYPRHSPSISPANILTVTSGNIDTATNILTKTAGTVPSTGSPIKYVYDRASQIGGLTTPTVYYCIKLSSSTFKLATSKDNADAGIAIDITSTGATNNYFMALEVYDYGANIATRSGAVALFDINSATYNTMIFGSELNDYATQADYANINVLCDGFESRGYFVTSKIVSQNAKDVLQKLFFSHRPLNTGDKIIYKYKDKDIIGLPVSSAQARSTTINQCAWTDTTNFTTTTDMSAVKTAFDNGIELECEVIAGAGAGVLAKISNVTYSSSTYTITLSEAVSGASASRYCDVLIDNWKVIGTITSTTNNSNLQEVVSGNNSDWFKIKGELRGSNVSIYNQKFINAMHQKAV